MRRIWALPSFRPAALFPDRIEGDERRAKQINQQRGAQARLPGIERRAGNEMAQAHGQQAKGERGEMLFDRHGTLPLMMAASVIAVQLAGTQLDVKN